MQQRCRGCRASAAAAAGLLRALPRTRRATYDGRDRAPRHTRL